MAAMGTCKPAVVLGLVVAALVMAEAQAATVTIYNPAGMVVNLQLQDDTQNQRVEMTTSMMTMEIPQEQQNMQISQAGGEVVEVSVRDGDVLVLIPDPTDHSGKVIMAFKVVDMAATPVVPEPADDMAAAGESKASSVHYSAQGPIPAYDRAYNTRVFDAVKPPYSTKNTEVSDDAVKPPYSKDSRLFAGVKPPGFD